MEILVAIFVLRASGSVNNRQKSKQPVEYSHLVSWINCKREDEAAEGIV